MACGAGSATLAFGIPGIGEWWPILLVAFLFFGAQKLPGLARAMGSSITQFKKGLKEGQEELLDDGDDKEGSASEESEQGQ